MKKIIKLNPRLDLEMAFGIDSLKIKKIEIIPCNVVELIIDIEVISTKDTNVMQKLDENIKSSLKEYKNMFKIRYNFNFSENEELKNIVKYLLDYIKYENKNSEIFENIEIQVNDNKIYLVSLTSITKEIMLVNKVDKKLIELLKNSLKKEYEVIFTSEAIKTEIIEKKEIKPIIVDFEIGKQMEIEGYIFKIFEKPINKKDGTKINLVTFYVTDDKRTVLCKKFYQTDDYGLKEKDIVNVKGEFVKDYSFEKDYYIKIKEIKKVGTHEDIIVDDAPVKRVELGIRTNMSEMYSNIDCEKLNSIIKKIGHKAYAVTDLGVVHSFPFIYKNSDDILPILGMSAYVVDDSKELVVNPRDIVLEDETYVIFDIETTGFNPYEDKIIEIGAVKMRNFEIIDEYMTFINPQMPIPEEIQKLTNISDDDVKDARLIDEVILEFLEFVKDTTLVAHNAKFDIGFIIEKLKQLNYEKMNFSYIDTIEWAKLTLKDQKRFNLAALCKRFDIENENHHRAINDAKVTAKLFMELLNRVRDMKVSTLKDVAQKLQLDIKLAPVNLTTILLKNQEGLKYFYEMVSKSLIDYYGNKIPRIPKSMLEKYRKYFYISPSPSMEFNSSGELVSMYIRGIDSETIEEACEFYDFIQVYPSDKYEKEIAKGEIGDEEYVRKMNIYFYNLAKKLGKKVVAIAEPCYINKNESKVKKVLQVANSNFSSYQYESNSHFRTTNEMLEDFSYMGDVIAYEIVVKNTNEIADSIQKVKPVPSGFYPPEIEGAVEKVKELTYQKAFELYGDNIPEFINERINRELDAIINNGFAVLYLIAQKLVKKSVDNGYLVGSRGSVGSSIVAYLMGITEVNALPPHYRCPKCKKVFLFDMEKSGVDLDVKMCEKCNVEYIRDGHAIPFEVFMGFNGDKVPDIDLNFSGEYQGEIHKYTEELFGKENTFRAGTISTNKFNNAFGYVKKYVEITNKENARNLFKKVYGENAETEKFKEFEKEYIDEELRKNKAEAERLAFMLEGTRKTTGQHPGGMIVIPNNKSIYEFTPIQKPANDMNADSITTHFDYHVMDEQLVKLDILGHDDPTTLKNLQDLTGLSPYNIPLTDEKVLSLFSGVEALNVSEKDIETELGTNGIPEFGTSFVKGMLRDTRPKTFTELVRISGLSHGTDVWLNNAQYYVNEGIASLNEIITVRDDIMNYLILQGMDKGLSFKIMEFVRKGRPHKDKEKWNEYKKEMQDAGVKDWYIDSCEKIKYMFPKGHAVAYVMMAVRIAYFKVYYPLEFYTAFLNRKVRFFSISKMYLPIDKLKKEYYELREKPNKNPKDTNEFAVLEILIEMHYRGIELTNVDIYKSEARDFTIDDGKIRMPLIAVDKLGEQVAQNISDERIKSEFTSQEDLCRRTGVNKTVLATLISRKIIKDLNETDQQTLF